VSASDGIATGSQSFTWTVAHITIVNPGNQSNAVGDAVWLPINATDNDGGPLSYSATGLPTGLSINSTTGEISGTIATGAQTGSPYTVTLTATHGTANASTSFTWTVAQVLLVNPGNQSSAVGDDVLLPINATDNDGGPLTYSAAALPTGLTINSSTGDIKG